MDVRIEFRKGNRTPREFTNVLMAHSSSVRTAIPTFAIGSDNRKELLIALTKDSVITDMDENGKRDKERQAGDVFPELLTDPSGYKVLVYCFYEIDKVEITF